MSKEEKCNYCNSNFYKKLKVIEIKQCPCCNSGLTEDYDIAFVMETGQCPYCHEDIY